MDCRKHCNMSVLCEAYLWQTAPVYNTHIVVCWTKEGELEMKVPIAKLEILKQFVDCAGNNSTSEPKPPKSLGYGLFNEFRLKFEIVYYLLHCLG